MIDSYLYDQLKLSFNPKQFDWYVKNNVYRSYNKTYLFCEVFYITNSTIYHINDN